MLASRNMNLELLSATAKDLSVVKNLVRYYIYDMSEYMGWDCNNQGQWDGCDDLTEYWDKSDHHPFVVRIDNSIAGFAMVRIYPEETDRHEIGEFFIARKFKGRGAGKICSFRLFDKFPGKWIVRVLDSNTGARLFWDKVINKYTNCTAILSAEEYVCPHSGIWPMQYYRFESKGQPNGAPDADKRRR